jgi:hypothetical protein
MTAITVVHEQQLGTVDLHEHPPTDAQKWKKDLPSAQKNPYNVMYKFIFSMLQSSMWIKSKKIGEIWKEHDQMKRMRPTVTFW